MVEIWKRLHFALYLLQTQATWWSPLSVESEPRGSPKWISPEVSVGPACAQHPCIVEGLFPCPLLIRVAPSKASPASSPELEFYTFSRMSSWRKGLL